MKNLPQSLLTLVLLLPLLSFAAEEPAPLIEPELLYTGSTLLERKIVDYPASALQRGEEGWVQMSFIVNKEGKVADAMIMDSSGNADIERAALKALNGWKFTPAKVGDEPVESSETDTILRFNLEGGETGARRSFIRKYSDINTMITSGNTGEVEAELTELRFTEKQNLYEDAWFWWLDTAYAQKIDDKDRMLTSVTKALSQGDFYLPEDIYVYASQLAYKLNVDTYDLQDAFTYLNKLKESEKAKKAKNYEAAIAALEAHAINVRALVDGPEVIVVAGEIRDDNYWFHALARSAFTLTEIQGKIGSVEVRCNLFRVRRYTFVADVDWEIPASWKDCSVFLKGDVGTTFKLYELPQQELAVAE